jgi:hypothetical protein
LYCPSSQTFDLDFQPQSLAAAMKPAAELSWFGLPGSALGGMTPPPTQVEPTLFNQPYAIGADQPTVESVPLATWSSKCFAASWSAASAHILNAELQANSEGQISGTIRLAEGADLKLADCVLFYEGWAYVVGSLSPERSIKDWTNNHTAETQFAERRAGGDREVAPYDRAGLDRGRVLEIMMFYRAAGGRRYTGLLNRYLHTIDLSDQLTLGRAILIGKGPPAAVLKANGNEVPTATSEDFTWYRFVIPVQKANSPSPSGRGPG